MFHLGWFLGNGTGMYPWYGTWANTYGKDWTKPDFFIDLATSLERGGFDLLFIEDPAMLEDTYGGSLDMTLKYGMMAPKNDPMPYIPLMAEVTKHLGLVGTISTIQYRPASSSAARRWSNDRIRLWRIGSLEMESANLK